MRILILSVLLFCVSGLFSQDEIYGISGPLPPGGKMPEFKGGESAFYEFLRTNIHYPQQAVHNNIQGQVLVSFIVDKDGLVSDIKILLSLGGGCDEEAIRVINLTNGMWQPGKIDDEPISVQFTLPLKFGLAGYGQEVVDESASYNKGVKLMKEEKYDKALTYFTSYQPDHTLYPDAIYASGMCKFMQSDYKGAITDWESAKSAGNKEASPKLALAYFKLGNEYQKEKKHAIAISCYAKSLENVPNDINVLYNRGISYMFQGDKENACKDWLRIRELGSQDAEQVIKQYCE